MRILLIIAGLLLFSTTVIAQKTVAERQKAQQAHITKPQRKPKVFKHTEQRAIFPGDAGEYIRNRLRYPDDAREAGAEGKVDVLFEISVTGTVRIVSVRSSSKVGSLEAEARRTVSGMPAWKPATKNGRPVRSLMLLPVVFSLLNK